MLLPSFRPDRVTTSRRTSAELRLTGRDREKKEKRSWVISFAGHDLFHVLRRSVNAPSYEAVTVQIREIRVRRKNGRGYRVFRAFERGKANVIISREGISRRTGTTPRVSHLFINSIASFPDLTAELPNNFGIKDKTVGVY